MHYYTGFICLLLILVISSVSGDSVLLTPEEWKNTKNGSFQTLTKEEVDTLINPVMNNGTYVGLMVILVDSAGYRVSGYGTIDNQTRKIPDEDTIMGLGSVSKVFTGILLAGAEEEGKVNRSDPIGNYLTGVIVPSWNGREITLLDLATHTSGLPSVPDDFMSAAGNAWSVGDYDAYEQAFAYHSTMQADNVYSWLSQVTLTRKPGTAWEYSNVGTGIAGNILARVQNDSFEDLLETQVLAPLSMNNTTISFSDDQKQHLSPGHRGYTGSLDEARFIEFNDFWAPSGGIYSSGRDMAVFLAANLGLVDTPLASAIQKSRVPQAVRATEPILIEQSLFWDVLHIPGGSVLYVKSGETNGYQAHVILDPVNQTGVMVIANTAYLFDIHVETLATGLMKKIIEQKDGNNPDAGQIGEKLSAEKI